MTASRSVVAEYLRFVGWAVVAAAVTGLLGYVPTRRLAGEGAVPSMLAGCFLALLASAVGGLAVARSRRQPAPSPAHRLQVMMLAMGLRLGILALLGTAAALSGWFVREPLLLWIGISYVALLAVDTAYAVKGF